MRLDLSGFTWCDDGVLYTILGIRQAIAPGGGSLTLIAVAPVVARALARTGLTNQLPVAPD